MWVTWNHQDTDFNYPLSFEDKVDIYYEGAMGWQLHVADLLANGGESLGECIPVAPMKHSGFAVLHICLSYFETVGQYEQKNPRTRSSVDYFKAGVRSVFPTLDAQNTATVNDALDTLYKKARCGLYHNSRTRSGVGLGGLPPGQAIVYEQASGTLVFSPEELPKALKRHLQDYRVELLNPANTDSRLNFERQFNKDYGT